MASAETVAQRRHRMVAEQIARRGLADPAVLDAMGRVERHRFVPPELFEAAYADMPLPIGSGQTISQPYIVALMTELLRVGKGDRVLEVGLGSGYQAAVLAAMGVELYALEIVPELAAAAAARLRELGYAAQIRTGDGYDGWPEAAPFAGILVSSAPPLEPPAPLLAQLADGGRLVVPVGIGIQQLLVITREGERYRRESVLDVRFVPMTGRVQLRPRRDRDHE